MPKDVMHRMQLKTLTATAAIVMAGLPVAAALAADTNAPDTGRQDARLAQPLHQDGVVQMMRDRGRRLERHRELVSTNVRLARTSARLRGERLRGDRREKVDDWANRRLKASNRHLREQIRELRSADEAPAAPATGPSTASAGLQAIAACESGGDPTAVDATGTYRGKYQFDRQTWAAVGGSGDPAAAPEAEQDQRAAMLIARSGSNPWPVCGS
jgi:Transglycosylase-like domain